MFTRSNLSMFDFHTADDLLHTALDSQR